MSKHTPGPWIWGKDYDGLYGAGPDNDVLTFARYEGMWLAYGSHREADARLIAAAPELLAALIALERTAGIPAMNDDPVRVKARAAIAKATGENNS